MHGAVRLRSRPRAIVEARRRVVRNLRIIGCFLRPLRCEVSIRYRMQSFERLLTALREWREQERGSLAYQHLSTRSDAVNAVVRGDPLGSWLPSCPPFNVRAVIIGRQRLRMGVQNETAAIRLRPEAFQPRAAAISPAWSRNGDRPSAA